MFYYSKQNTNNLFGLHFIFLHIDFIYHLRMKIGEIPGIRVNNSILSLKGFITYGKSSQRHTINRESTSG